MTVIDLSPVDSAEEGLLWLDLWVIPLLSECALRDCLCEGQGYDLI